MQHTTQAAKMRFEENTSVDHAAAKVVTAGAAGAASALSINSWGDAAAFAAFCYSVILIVEWMWRRFLRDMMGAIPICKRRGWFQPQRRRREDYGYKD